jgi:hypothetical protein
MKKKIIKFLLFLIITLTLIILYLSIFGISTEKFNKKIQTEILNINKKINLKLKKVTILLDPLDFSLDIKTIAPEIIIENNQLKLESIKTRLPIKSLINNNFTIDNIKISTKTIRLKDIIILARSFKSSAELFILDRVIKDGVLIADIHINFDNNGKIKNDYKINGFIKKAKVDIFKKYDVENLNLLFKIQKNKFFLQDLDAKINQLKFSAPLIEIEKKKDKFKIKGKVITDKKGVNTKTIKDLFKESFKTLKIEDISFNSENKFSLDVNSNFKINNFKLETSLDLNNLKYQNNSSTIKKYLPNFKKFIKLKNHKILINYSKNQLDIKGKGQITIDDKSDKLDYEIIKKNDKYIFNSNINIKNNFLTINAFQYEKKENINSLLSLKGKYKKNKEIELDLVSLKVNNDIFLVKNLRIDKDFKIKNIDLLELNYFNKNKIHNQLNLKKVNKNYELFGKSFDAIKLVDQILDDTNADSSFIFKNLNSKISVKILKVYLDKSTYLNNLSGYINFKNNDINKLSLYSTFPNSKELTLTINTNANKDKITTLYSDYPKPIIKRYKFINGFEEGVLDFYSIKKGDISNSVLKIDNFKVQEVPVLAKLLSLASLQGIADLLTGEGIRFTNLEMKFSNKDKLTIIQEMYAIGPAISILLEGYIESKKLISLKGTLVPATTINKTIASIPLLGDILVGKKAGEGIFGVSFKLKGAPKDLKTTVNPIKTLTPRFITRTLEKIKKN